MISVFLCLTYFTQSLGPSMLLQWLPGGGKGAGGGINWEIGIDIYTLLI